jgi:carbamoyltransferase
MKVLGISGRYRDAAAALAVDGRLIAAVAEECLTRVPGVGYAQTGGFPGAAAAACLATAGMPLSAVDAVAVVDESGASSDERAALRRAVGDAPIHSVAGVDADAVQASALHPHAAVLVCSTDPQRIASFVRCQGELRVDREIHGGQSLAGAAGVVARALGISANDSYAALDSLGADAEPEFLDEMSRVAVLIDGTGVDVDASQLQSLIAGAGGDALADSSSLNVRVQDARKALAASFTCGVAAVVRDLAENVRTRSGATMVAFGGGMFANPRLNTELRRLSSCELSLAIVPEPAGRAVGAAMALAGPLRDPLTGLAIGPAFSDVEVKRTLDNCRLDYVYEPDWQRILQRVSRMLAHGKVVAWFQGPMAFGPRAMGTRSVLCDPSNRYARHNMNEFLRQVPLDQPLPLVFAPSAAARCLATSPGPTFSVRDVSVLPEWRDKLAGGLDSRHSARVHMLSPDHAPHACDLLEHHYARTGVPALIEINLGAPGEPVACSPRDAVKTVYSSAIDALIIGRFVLMKDYWLLRSHADD